MSRFRQDVIDLFSHKRGGHVEQWLYSDTVRAKYTGSELWHQFLKASKDYYILPNEIDLIGRVAKNLPVNLSDIDTVVDFGVGDSFAIDNKVVPLIRGLENVKIYAGIDLSGEFLKNVQKRIQHNFPKLAVKTFQADFYQDNFSLPGKKRLGLMLGSTITNQDMREGDEFPRQEIVQRLVHLRHLIGEGGQLFITHDANPDSKSATKAYQNTYWSQHVTGIMYDVAKFAKGNFSPTAWKHEVIWDERAHVVQQCAAATQAQEFSIYGHYFNISKGQRFVTVNNFKYPKDLFISMSSEAGFTVQNSIPDKENRMCLQHLTIQYDIG